MTLRGGLLGVLHALASGERAFRIESLQPLDVEQAVACGFGPALAHVTANTGGLPVSVTNQLAAADLTARLLTAATMETVAHALAAGHDRGCDPILLKGCATALRYYDEPHLRTMGDVDLLIEPDRADAFAALLRELGFMQRRPSGVVDYKRHHHTMPYWHPERRVWIELHTRPFPARSPMATDARFEVERLRPWLSTSRLGERVARVMGHELQLVYTAARWGESLNCDRGAWPLLDAALLIGRVGEALDWDRVSTLVEASWTADALGLLLDFLHHFELAIVPENILPRVRSNTAGSRLRARMLRSVVADYVIERRPPGKLLTQRNLRTIWATAMRPTPVWWNLLVLPAHIAFPPDDDERRFNMRHTLRRATTLIRGEKSS